MINIRVPAGIGDISWTYSKLINLNEKINWYISDDAPQRSLEYVKLFPLTESAQYIHWNFHNVADHTLPHDTTKENLLKLCRENIQSVSPNRWLEQGKTLDSFMPELYTTYHYGFNIPLHDIDFVEQAFSKIQNPIGIFTSSYQTNAVWSGWSQNNWIDLITGLHNKIKNLTFILLGAKWDKPYTDDLIKLLPNINLVDLCGQTHIARTIEIIRKLKYFIAFPSGLPVLANVLFTPVMMFYPHHLNHIMNTWPDPETVKNLLYKGCIFPKPQQALDFVIAEYGLQNKLQEVK